MPGPLDEALQNLDEERSNPVLDTALQDLMKRVDQPSVPVSGANERATPQQAETAIRNYRTKLYSEPVEGPLSPLKTLDPKTGQPAGLEQPQTMFGMAMERFAGVDVEDPVPLTRAGTTIAGAVGGGSIGSQVPGPPIAKGIGAAAGGLLGTVAGAAAPETMMEFLQSTGFLPAGTRERMGLDDEKLTTLLKGEAALDLYTGGGVTAARMTGRGISNIMTGADAVSRRLAETGAREGIAILPVQVGERQFGRGFVSVLGRFPWIASGLKRRAQTAMDRIQRAYDGIPARLGPLSTFDDVSGRILRDAQATSEAIANRFDQQFGQILQEADFRGIRVRPVRTDNATQRVLRRIAAERPQGPAGARVPHYRAMAQLESFLRQTTATIGREDNTLRAMDTMLRRVDEQMVRMAGTGDTRVMTRLEEVRDAITYDMFANLVGPRNSNPGEIAQRFRDADHELTFAVNALFDTQTARRAGATRAPTLRSARFDQNTINGLAQAVLRGGNARTVEELSRFVSHDTMRRLTSAAFSDALERSFTVTGENVRSFDVEQFSRLMGLNAPGSDLFQQTERLLQASGGMNMQQLQDLVEIGHRASRAEIPDVSAFIARRATFDGIRGAIKTAIPFAGVTAATYSTGAWGFIAAVGGGRLLSTIISNPRSARALRNVFDEEARSVVRRTAGIRAIGYAVHEGIDAGYWSYQEADNILANAKSYFGELTRQMDQNAE